MIVLDEWPCPARPESVAAAPCALRIGAFLFLGFGLRPRLWEVLRP